MIDFIYIYIFTLLSCPRCLYSLIIIICELVSLPCDALHSRLLSITHTHKHTYVHAQDVLGLQVLPFSSHLTKKTWCAHMYRDVNTNAAASNEYPNGHIGRIPSSFMASMTFMDEAQPRFPVVYNSPSGVNALPEARFPAGAVNASQSATGSGGGVSWREYRRVCANERTLAENVETLKALALQLAAQLSKAQEEVQLLERSSSSATRPLLPTASDEMGRWETSKSLDEGEAVRKELLDVIARKDRTIDALQQRHARQMKHFHTLLDDLTQDKDATIARLAMELDAVKSSKR